MCQEFKFIAIGRDNTKCFSVRKGDVPHGPSFTEGLGQKWGI